MGNSDVRGPSGVVDGGSSSVVAADLAEAPAVADSRHGRVVDKVCLGDLGEGCQVLVQGTKVE